MATDQSLDLTAVWRALPGRMPGMLPGTLALKFPGASTIAVTRALEAMVPAGWVIRVSRRGHDVYYRSKPPPVTSTYGGIQLSLLDEEDPDGLA